jgi:uncharacterized protein YggU (UPF0235/DUF167 family)
MATLRVHVVPSAKTDKIVGERGDAIKIKLRTPPVEGKLTPRSGAFFPKN